MTWRDEYGCVVDTSKEECCFCFNLCPVQNVKRAFESNESTNDNTSFKPPAILVSTSFNSTVHPAHALKIFACWQRLEKERGLQVDLFILVIFITLTMSDLLYSVVYLWICYHHLFSSLVILFYLTISLSNFLLVFWFLKNRSLLRADLDDEYEDEVKHSFQDKEIRKLSEMICFLSHHLESKWKDL